MGSGRTVKTSSPCPTGQLSSERQTWAWALVKVLAEAKLALSLEEDEEGMEGLSGRLGICWRIQPVPITTALHAGSFRQHLLPSPLHPLPSPRLRAALPWLGHHLYGLL